MLNKSLVGWIDIQELQALLFIALFATRLRSPTELMGSCEEEGEMETRRVRITVTVVSERSKDGA